MALSRLHIAYCPTAAAAGESGGKLLDTTAAAAFVAEEGELVWALRNNKSIVLNNASMPGNTWNKHTHCVSEGKNGELAVKFTPS